MWRIGRPSRSVLEAFQTCLSGVDSDELKARLERIQLTVVRESEEYAVAAAAGQFHTVGRAKRIDDCVTAEEMCELYTQHFSKLGSAGRALYDELKAGAPNGRCPLCGHGVVSTLDHFLPKYCYPVLSVTPLNLVPACRDCNINKGRRFPRKPQEATLHPYFDNVEDESWLGARVLEEKPAAVIFFVKTVPRWDEVTQARVKKHCKDLKLWRLYSANAADEMSGIRESLKEIFAVGGGRAVREYLREGERSRVRVRVNSWQAATYGALAGSEWYWGGGFG